MTLRKFTKEELEAELKLRSEPPFVKPEQLRGNMPTGPLTKACQDYLDFVASEDYDDDRASNYKHSIYAAAMTAVFGVQVWLYINNRTG
jgi:hypothetical protein